MTITSDQIIALAGLIGAIGVIWAVVSKPIKMMKDVQDSIEELKDSVKKTETAVQLHGDMIYELLDHASTNNNSGGMAQVMKKFNETYRHNKEAS